MADIVSIGIAYDTSQLTTGARQVQSAMQQLTQAEKQTQTASEQLARSSTQTAQAMQQEGRAAQQASTGMQQLGTSAQAAGRQVSTLGSAMASFGQQVGAFGLAQLGVQGLTQALGTLKSTFDDVIRSGIQMAQLRQSFSAIAGGAAAGGREFQFVVRTANELGLELQSVATQYRSLTAATRGTALEGSATRELFVALTGAARAYGLSNEALGRALTAVQQIASKGKVTMEELRGQLGEALPGAVQILARAFGVTTQQLEVMVSKGLDATEALKKLTNQLGIEVPKGAERAGSGFVQLGNEILLLKDRIAQSGILRLADDVQAAWAKTLRTWREGEEQLQAQAEKRTARELGGAVTPDQLATRDREALTAQTRKVANAERDLMAITKAREERTFGFVTGLLVPERDERAARARLDTEREALKTMQARLTLSTLERQEQAKRQAAYTQPFQERQAADEQARAFLDRGRQLLEQQRKEQEALVTTTRAGLGRDPSAEEKVKLQEKQLKDTQEYLETNTKLAAEFRDDPVLKGLRERGQATEANRQAMKVAEQSGRDATSAQEKAARERQQAQEKAARERQQAQEEEARLDKQQAEEVRRTHFQNFQQLTRLGAQYSEVKAARDEDTASMLAASLATSQYAEKSRELLAVIQDVQKTEAKLPALRADAARSAGTLTDLQRLEQQLAPQRRGMSRAEQLAATRADIAALPGLDAQGRLEALARADAKIKEALDTERWQEWSDFATESIDRVGDAITQFAFHGKLTFKEMTNAIAEDFFRMSLRMLTESAFSGTGGGKGGGWLDLLLQAGKSVLGIAGGVRGGGSFAGGDAPGMQFGGTALAGVPYWVGEAGPELVVPKTTSTVIPHQQSMAMPAPTVNVYIQGVTNPNEWRPSQGAIQRTVAAGVSQAYRGL